MGCKAGRPREKLPRWCRRRCRHDDRGCPQRLPGIRRISVVEHFGEDRTFIKGQKYVLLSHRANLSAEKRRALQALLAARKRLVTAYVLKEQFAQL